MKKLFIIISLLLSASHSMGGQEGKGNFYDQQGRMLVKAATSKLIPFIESVNHKMFEEFPYRRELVLKALKNIILDPVSPTRIRDGKELLLDFDLKKNNIIVLRPFFEGYKVAPVNKENIHTVKGLLLRETSHLWGFDDEEADKFVESLLSSTVTNMTRQGIKPGLYVVFPQRKNSDCMLDVEVDDSQNNIALTWVSNPFTQNYCYDYSEIEGLTMAFKCNPHQNSCQSARRYKFDTDYETKNLSILDDEHFVLSSEVSIKGEVKSYGNPRKFEYLQKYFDKPARYFSDGRVSYVLSKTFKENCSLARDYATKEALARCKSYRGGIYKTCKVIEDMEEKDEETNVATACVVHIKTEGK